MAVASTILYNHSTKWMFIISCDECLSVKEDSDVMNNKQIYIYMVLLCHRTLTGFKVTQINMYNCLLCLLGLKENLWGNGSFTYTKCT